MNASGWGRSVRRKIRAAPCRLLQIALPHALTALQSNSTILSKKSDGCIDTHENGPGVGAPRPPHLWGGFSPEWGALGLGFRGVNSNLGLPPEARLR
jgi:hypothetical protein